MSLISNQKLLHNIHCIILVKPPNSHHNYFTYIPRTPELSVSEQDRSVGLKNREKKIKRLNITAVAASSCTEQKLLIFYPTIKVNTKKRYNFRSQP